MSVLLTKHPGHSENKVQRNTKGFDGSHLKTDVPIPETIYQYNKYMGVRSDQLIMCADKQRSTGKHCTLLMLQWSMLMYYTRKATPSVTMNS